MSRKAADSAKGEGAQMVAMGRGTPQSCVCACTRGEGGVSAGRENLDAWTRALRCIDTCTKRRT